MGQINNFIFDIDGTLIDTFDMYMPPMITILRQHGYHITPKDELPTMKKLFGITGADALRIFGVRPDERATIQKEWIAATYKRKKLVKVIDQVPKALAALAKVKGNHLAVATSKLRHEYETHFAPEYPFARLFEVAITSSDTIKHKPDPEPLLAAIAKLKAAPENCVYVGDTINDQKAARAAGIKFAGALYGSANPESIANADYPLRSPMDLLKI